MARWVDLRIPADDREAALSAILDAFAPVSFSIDWMPDPSSPNESQILIQDRHELTVERVLRDRGVTTLAIRTFLAPAAELAFDTGAAV